MTRKTLDKYIRICSFIGILIYTFYSFVNYQILYSLFFTWMTLPLALQAYRAELKRREENNYQIYKPNKFEKITGHATSVFFVLFSAGSLTIGVLILVMMR